MVCSLKGLPVVSLVSFVVVVYVMVLFNTSTEVTIDSILVTIWFSGAISIVAGRSVESFEQSSAKNQTTRVEQADFVHNETEVHSVEIASSPSSSSKTTPIDKLSKVKKH